jgi:hypothetical protein
MSNIFIKTIYRQLKQDLIGKDAYRGITLSYAWLANQFGHFALGFIPVPILYALFNFFLKGEKIFLLPYLPSAIVWLTWIAFEIVNFYKSVSRKKNETAIIKKAKEYFYRPRRGHFYYDLYTDLGFFAFGASSALLLITFSVAVVWFCIAIAIMLIIPSRYWYSSKIYLQRALYPFQYRLSQWKTYVSVQNKDAINRFMEEELSPLHLLLLGEDDYEKIHMCVGIGSEMSYQHKKCRYLTAIKAFECFYRKAAADGPASPLFSWSWQEAALLIIDDINPSHSDIKEVISTNEFLEKINANYGAENKKLLTEKKVIWVLGNENTPKEEEENWKKMLLDIGVHAENIIVVNLSEKTGVNEKPVTVKYDFRKQNLQDE